MNIFVLDEHPVKAAGYHCDKHVVKMIVESAQILSTVRGGPLKATHANHPCVKWVRESDGNYRWLWVLMNALSNEYTNRYLKVHLYARNGVIEELMRCSNAEALTPFVQVMPDEYRREKAVDAYRAYYLGDKVRFAKWKNEKPEWWTTVEP